MPARISWVNGYVNLRTNGAKTKRKSLGIRITKEKFNRFFNQDKQLFNKTANGVVLEEYQYYNHVIQETLKKYEAAGSNIEVLNGEKKSFLTYWKKIIDTTAKHGTRIKNENVKSKLEKYLASIHQTDLLFKDITTAFLRSFQRYMLETPDPKQLSQNSANHYLKIINSVINKAEKDEHFNYFKNPFKPIKYQYDKIHREVLTQEQVHKLLNTNIPLTSKKYKTMDLHRDMLLFQIFANGMRVSDMLTLRWNNFDCEKEMLVYTMIKTGVSVPVPINRNLCFLLAKQLGVPDRYQELIENMTLLVVDPSGKNKEQMTIGELDKKIATLTVHQNKARSSKKFDEVFALQKLTGKIIEYRGYYMSEKDVDYKKRLIDYRDEVIDKNDKVFIGSIMGRIRKIKNRDSFVFPKLKDEDFKNIKSNNNFRSLCTIDQYKTIKHNTIVYDRGLKHLTDFCKMELSISSHTSRHTFTNLLLLIEDVNLYDISQMLAHSSIAITDKYLKNGFNSPKQEAINKLLAQRIRKDH